MTYELTRRDAIAALGAAGVAVGGAVLASETDDEESEHADTAQGPVGEHEHETVLAVAEVVYPSAVENVPEFVESYLRGRVRDDDAHGRAVAETVGYLDDYAATWYPAESFASLAPDTRDDALRRMGVDRTAPDPEGGDVQRVRYYLINDLLFALYASPTGGELVGIENPQGYPGGTDSYRRGPPS